MLEIRKGSLGYNKALAQIRVSYGKLRIVYHSPSRRSHPHSRRRRGSRGSRGSLRIRRAVELKRPLKITLMWKEEEEEKEEEDEEKRQGKDPMRGIAIRISSQDKYVLLDDRITIG
ncbi:hypothetical protein M0802_003837 [Mischocyttarus mexicanus]|nr:hypothetical protein M0802_003837 [Mischocyttarus mexicanus]